MTGLTSQSSAVPLLFSLLVPLSASVSHPDYPIIHVPYFRILLRALLFPSASLRGAVQRKTSSSTGTINWNIVAANQVDSAEGVLPNDAVNIVVTDFWAKYDDIRWAFFREAA
jgi:U3 small nucleolar RNA-associated protein 19